MKQFTEEEKRKANKDIDYKIAGFCIVGIITCIIIAILLN